MKDNLKSILKKIKEIIFSSDLIAISLLGVAALFFYTLKIRSCIIFNIFKIPCPSCGLTRASVSILKGDIKRSLEYNYLGIIIFILFFIYLGFKIFYTTEQINNFINKNSKIIIPIVIIITAITWYINLNNPLLY